MVKFLTSDVGASKKINGVRIVSKLNNTNRFVEILQKYITTGENFVFIASNPSAYSKTDAYAKLTFDSFNMSGFNFKNLQVVDDRTSADVENIIKHGSIIYLGGGDTLTQMNFFNKIGLSSVLKKYGKIVIGQSAGALNLADEVYCSPEDEEWDESKKYFKGLGLTKINIEPHYNNSHSSFSQDALHKMLLQDSRKKSFIAITDGSFIVDDGKTQTLFGEGYLFSNGECSQICKNGESFDVTKLLDKKQTKNNVK